MCPVHMIIYNIMGARGGGGGAVGVGGGSEDPFGGPFSVGAPGCVRRLPCPKPGPGWPPYDPHCVGQSESAAVPWAAG